MTARTTASTTARKPRATRSARAAQSEEAAALARSEQNLRPNLTPVPDPKPEPQPSTTARKPRQPRASRGTSASAADQARPQLSAVPNLPSETPKAQPEPKPEPKPPVLGKSGYRAKYGVTDEQILKAIRDHFTANPGQGTVADWDDEKILGAIGWALNLTGALRKLRPLLAASKGTKDS